MDPFTNLNTLFHQIATIGIPVDQCSTKFLGFAPRDDAEEQLVEAALASFTEAIDVCVERFKICKAITSCGVAFRAVWNYELEAPWAPARA